MSEDTILQVKGLTKWFGKIKAVSDVNFSVNRGQVVGILGPNGSGKTTTLAILLGIKHSSQGTFSWFQGPLNASFNTRVGALLEVPYFFPYLNLRKNLEIVAHVRGRGHKEIPEVLDLVGLGSRSKSPYYTLSLGMKQRLAIASTLLGDPEVLVLDEPTNGLDPEGIAEVRDIIKQQSERGKTIILASHILAEVERVCSDVIILKNGEVLSQGSVAELLQDKMLVTISAENLDALVKALNGNKRVEVIEVKEQKVVVSLEEGLTTADLNKWLMNENIVLNELTAQKKSLESQFLELVKQ